MPYLILIFAIFHFAKGNMTVTPRNAVVLAGDRVELECRVEGNSTVYRWQVSKPSTVFDIENIFRLDYSGSPVVDSNFSHLGIDVDQTGSGIIYYNSTDLEDAGNYTCRAHIGSDKEKIFYSAQLIVLESLPNCTSNDSSVNFEAITLQCSLNFRGFWAPTMNWTRHDGNGIANGKGQEVEGGIETQTIPNSHVTSSLTVRRNSLGEGTFFSCRIHFERKFDGILIMNATNTPDFVYVWNSFVYSKDPSSSEAPEHTGQRPKGNMTVTPRNTVVLAGDRVELECRVEGNSTIYRWEVSKPSTKFRIENIFILDKNSGSPVVDSNISNLGFDVDNTGSGIIYYNSTDLENAGNYTCRAHIGHDKETILYSAQLIVWEFSPNCISNYSRENESSKDFEAITMQCSLRFRGFWAPTMQWTQYDGNGNANGKGQEVEGTIENQTVPNSHVTSSLTVSRDSLQKETFFSCRIYFERKFDGLLVMNATNIPDFLYVWNSSVYSFAMEQTDSNLTRVTAYSVIGAVILFGVIVFVAFAVVGYYKRKLSGKKSSVYEVNKTLEDAADDYETMRYATSDQYETIEEVTPQNVLTSSSPRSSTMTGNTVILQAESEAPNVYNRICDLNVSTEPYNTNADQSHQINTAFVERCYLELL